MGALNKRVYQDLQAAKQEISGLKAEKAILVHECRLAYLEGLDQGKVLATQEGM